MRCKHVLESLDPNQPFWAIAPTARPLAKTEQAGLMMAEPPPRDRLADAPDPPDIEVNGALFLALEKIAKELEDARKELMQLHGMLRCLADVLMYADDDDSVMHSDVAAVAARLLNDVVTNLELTKSQIPTSKEMARSVMGESDKEVEA